jgi:hypothetical protein
MDVPGEAITMYELLHLQNAYSVGVEDADVFPNPAPRVGQHDVDALCAPALAVSNSLDVVLHHLGNVLRQDLQGEAA